MSAVVLASHLPNEGHFESARHLVIPFVCWDDFSYWHGILASWDGPETIVNIEHDVEVTDDQIADLLACPHPLCSWMYAAHWASTHLADDVIAARNGGKFIDEGTEWAEQSAIGFVKITPEARIAPLRKTVWQQLEVAIEEAVMPPWHMHGPPVPHHHW